mmetsp:Transcript_82425/g.191474  ORF Transcript_82425/g.191474 Transcript_82425/m.191474 type:complete len:338 (-) Transcript_82425:95-1108(-)
MCRRVAVLAVVISGATGLNADVKTHWGWSFFGKDNKKAERKAVPQHDLAFMHIPSTHGHTIEKVAMFRKNATMQDMISFVARKGGTLDKTTLPLTWTDVMTVVRGRDAEVWGRMSPQLQWTSNVTGCNLYHTPQKYWPERSARKYFRNMTVFGVLRDPYERLVALFRANPDNFGKYGKLRERCDVNSAIKNMMKKYIEGGDKFMEACALIPQAEYFEGPYGIKLAVDGRKFPSSVNELFKEHGYGSMQIESEDMLRPKECTNVWAGDLDMQTKKLVRDVYTRDFDLLCKQFGYCNPWESTCAEGVPELCPKKATAELQIRRFWGFEPKSKESSYQIL